MKVSNIFLSYRECHIFPFFDISITNLNMYFTASKKMANLMSLYKNLNRLVNFSLAVRAIFLHHFL